MSKNKRRYPRSQANRHNEISNSNEPMYISWAGSDVTKQVAAFEQMSKAIEEFQGVTRASHTDYSDLATNVSGRPGLDRSGYSAHRPHEAIPIKPKEIIRASNHAYQTNGLIRNIIDLMADFACQGVRLVHPNKRIEKFYRDWFKKVKGKDRSERFLNHLYRHGNVVIRKQTAKVKSNDNLRVFRSFAKPDMTITRKKINSREIPWKYNFIEPTQVVIVGGPLASFVGSPVYAVSIDDAVRRLIQSPKSGAEKKLVSELPQEIRNAAKTRKPVLLDPDKTSVFHYKKDDWQTWASPMIYSILKDIIVLEKLKLADLAALDGAISNIRVWKLGSLAEKIAPSRAAIARLAEILESHTGVGTMDLVWGPDIDLLESKTQVHHFLGEEKYKPTLNAIYAGLGIPPTLTGTFGAAGTTNNFISLKTLTQRLEYGRSVLREFWEVEIEAVQKAMGFRFPAQLEFDKANLADEEAEKALLIQLADRNLISDELLQTKFGNDPAIEKVRLNREHRDRESGKMIPKSSPYHDPMFGIALKKIALQTGVMTPGQSGIRKDQPCSHLKLYEKEPGEKLGVEFKTQGPPGGSSTKKKGQPQSGRPKNSKDSSKRATKTFKPKSKAVLEIWAQEVQEAVADILNPGLLDQFGKKNMRSLSNNEVQEAEKIKSDVLYHLEPLGVVSKEAIASALDKGPAPEHLNSTYKLWVNQVTETLDRNLTIVDECRNIHAKVYATYYGDE